MSAPRDVAALRVAMARMLYDPAYVARVYAGPVDGLSEAERALLTRVDRRAWGVDKYRRSRAVHAIIDEYPVTAAILGVQGVDAFFSSTAFARTLSGRGSLGLDFGSWAAVGRAGSVARLEAAIARARRAEATPGAGMLTRPGVVPLTLPGGVLAWYAAQRQALGPEPVRALAAGRPPVPPPVEQGEPEHLLLERDAQGQVGVGGGSAGLVALLSATMVPRPREAVLARARELGCDPGEDAELVDDLINDGLLLVQE